MNNLKEYEKEFKKIKDRVEFILENSNAARNDDTTLCFLYWFKFDGLNDGLQLENMKKVFNNYSNFFNLKGTLTPPESITRVRRVIQCKEGRFKPNNEVIEERFKRQETHKEFYSTKV